MRVDTAFAAEACCAVGGGAVLFDWNSPPPAKPRHLQIPTRNPSDPLAKHDMRAARPLWNLLAEDTGLTGHLVCRVSKGVQRLEALKILLAGVLVLRV